MRIENDDPAAVDRTRRGALLTGAAAAAGLLAAGAATAQPPAAPAPRPLRIVLHVSDPDGWPPALSNARNLAAQHPEIRVRIVTDGGGVYGLQGANDLTALMAAVAGSSVQFEACRNALDEKKIAPSALPPFVKVVPAGVIALAQAQADGFAYVKP
jgi:intracellular sulfur oxidation DsrE/DsrF family protein